MTKDVLTHLIVADPDSWDPVTIESDGVTAVIVNSAPEEQLARARTVAHHLGT